MFYGHSIASAGSMKSDSFERSVEGDVARKNTGMKLAEVMNLTRSALRATTAADWEKVVKHTIEVENKHWRTDGLREAVDPFIIDIEDDDSDEQSDSDEDEDL